MKAPDKIYLVETTRIIDEWRRKPSQYAKNIEYIRKDALLEWLKSELENGGPATLVQHIINRINTL